MKKAVIGTFITLAGKLKTQCLDAPARMAFLGALREARRIEKEIATDTEQLRDTLGIRVEEHDGTVRYAADVPQESIRKLGETYAAMMAEEVALPRFLREADVHALVSENGLTLSDAEPLLDELGPAAAAPPEKNGKE